MNTKLLISTALLLAAALGYLLFNSSSDHAVLDAELTAARASIEKLQAELNDLKAAQIPAADLTRLKTDQRDAIKLRGELSALKQSLAIAQKEGAAAQKLAAIRPASPATASTELVTAPLPEDNPDVRVFKTARLTASLPVGNFLAVGGWENLPGKRLFALVRPVRIDAAGNVINGDAAAQTGKIVDQVTVTTKWVQLPTEEADKLGLGKYLDTSGQQSASFDGRSYDSFVKNLETASGIDLLSAPSVTTLAGRQASISVTETRATSAGPVEFGPKIDIIPTLSEDHSQFNITMQASMTDSKNPPQKPSQ